MARKLLRLPGAGLAVINAPVPFSARSALEDIHEAYVDGCANGYAKTRGYGWPVPLLLHIESFRCTSLTFRGGDSDPGKVNAVQAKPRLMAEQRELDRRFLRRQELHRKVGTSPKEVYERLDRAGK